MDAAKAYEILCNYKQELGATMTPDERDAFDKALELLNGQASVDEEAQRLWDLGHYDNKKGEGQSFKEKHNIVGVGFPCSPEMDKAINDLIARAEPNIEPSE